MAKTVDDRVVSASFETSKFEAGTQKMLSGIDKLKGAMKFDNAGKGLEKINAAAAKTDLSHISRGIDSISGKLSALRLTAIATFAGLVTGAVRSGAAFVKQFTVAPIMQGLHEYENQLNSVQTILANTKDQGTNIKQVNAALDQLNQYADKTIYNFGQMTKNVGTFTAAGVDLKTSVASIKGVSNLAALSGSSAQQASTAMYQLSQAISSGRVSLQDWNSVVNAGMGGAVFQKSLMRTAENMGALKDGAVEIDKATGKATVNGKSFRESIAAKPGQQSWLTGEVLTNTLKQLSGEMTDAQLKAEGFTDAQIKAIQAQAKTALEAATKVKTFSQLVDTTKEAIGSGWASTFEIIFGDFEEAKKLWTGLAGVIGGFVHRSADARNKMLSDWKELGGRDLLIKSLSKAFHALQAILDPIRVAFREIFPKKTGKDLFRFTQAFANLVDKLVPSKETVHNLHDTFKGFFAVLHIGKTILGGVISVIGKLFGAVGHGSGGFLELTAGIGNWLVKVDEALTKGDALSNFFDKLGDIIKTPIDFLVALGHALGDAFSGDSIDAAGKALSPLQQIINGIVDIWDKFLGSVGSTREVVKPALEGLSEMFGAFGDAMAEAVKGANFDALFKVLEVGLLGGIFLVLKKGLGSGLADTLGGGVLGGLAKALTGFGSLGQAGAGALNAYTGQLQAMQTKLKSEALRNLAIAIALIAASVIGLSLVNPERLNSAMTAITLMFGQLLAGMAILDKIGKSAGFVKTPVIAASLILLAGAIGVLAISVYAMSRLSWEELAKGLGAVTLLLTGISAASGPLSANSAGLIRAATGITIIGVALNILAQAVKSFGGMNMETLGKGIGGIALALAGIGAAAHLFPSGMVAMGVGLIAIGAGLKLIAGTVQTLGALDMQTLGKGIGSIAVALAAIGLAMKLMPGPSMVITAAGLVLVSIALQGIAKSIGAMGGMSIEEIAKGIGSMAAALSLLALGLMAMSGTFGGAAALAVAAAGIALLAPALKTLGDQSWGQIIKGLVALGAAFVLLGVAGTVLAPVAPAILALGAALIAVGAGLALAGAGIFLIGLGLSAIAVAGPAAIKILVDALAQLVEALPKTIEGLVKALLQLVVSVSNAAPKFVKAVGKILAMVAQAIIVAAPLIGKAFVAVLEAVFLILRKEFPNLVKTGFEMLKALLKGIEKNITGVVKMAVNIVAKLLNGIASGTGKIISAGANILVAFVKGIGNNVGKVVTAAVSIVTNFLRGIANNIRKVAAAGTKVITEWLKAVGKNGPKILRAGTDVIVKFVRGIGNAAGRVVTAALKTVTKFISTVSSQIPKEVNKIATAVIKMLNALADVIRKREPEFIGALANVGAAIVEGIVSGLTGIGGKIVDKLEAEIKKVPGGKLALKAFGKLASAKLPLPSGLGTKFGRAFTNEVISHMELFEGDFQKELATIGGAGNVEFLYNTAVDLSRTFMDGLLEGMERPEASPLEKLQAIGTAFTEQLATSRAEIENVILVSHNKIQAAATKIDKLNDARDKAEDIKDKKRRTKRLADIDERLAQQKKIRDEEGKTIAVQDQRLKKIQETSDFIKNDTTYQQQLGELVTLKNNVQDLNDKLELHISELEDLKQKRQELFNQNFEKFSSLPGIEFTDADGNAIDPTKQVNDYITTLSGADDAIGLFANSMGQLLGMNLNTRTYQQLLDIGPPAQKFVDTLLGMGQGAVNAINAADTELKNAAGTLAEHGASQMHDAGINLVQGLIDGVKEDIPKAVSAVDTLVAAIIKRINKKLGIKSPSRVFAEIGAYSVEGMALGFTNSSKMVTDAVYGVSDEAKAAIKASVRGISDIVTDAIDPNPTITPILDLSQIHAGASQMGSILSVPTASLALASGVIVPGGGEDPSQTGQAAPIQFIQNNQSPKALSNVEIYRQTKNQLSQAKKVLT